MIAVTLPLVGGVLDGKTKDLPSWLQANEYIFKSLRDRCSSIACIWLSKVADLFRVYMGWSAQGLTKQTTSLRVGRRDLAHGRVVILPKYDHKGSFSRYNSIGCHRGQRREVDRFWGKDLTLPRTVLLRDAVRVDAVSEGVIADILDFSYQAQERMVA